MADVPAPGKQLLKPSKNMTGPSRIANAETSRNRIKTLCAAVIDRPVRQKHCATSRSYVSLGLLASKSEAENLWGLQFEPCEARTQMAHSSGYACLRTNERVRRPSFYPGILAHFNCGFRKFVIARTGYKELPNSKEPRAVDARGEAVERPPPFDP